MLRARLGPIWRAWQLPSHAVLLLISAARLLGHDVLRSLCLALLPIALVCPGRLVALGSGQLFALRVVEQVLIHHHIALAVGTTHPRGDLSARARID